MSDAANSGLTRLYLQMRPRLLRFFAVRTGSVAAGEDIVQELYIKVQLIDDTDVANGAAFLFKLGLNLMVDRYRSETQARRREREFAGGYGPGAPEGGGVQSIEDAAIARQELAALLQAVEQLPPKCRRVFRMHRLENKSHGEIARELGISRRAVEKHMTAALKRLAAALK